MISVKITIFHEYISCLHQKVRKDHDFSMRMVYRHVKIKFACGCLCGPHAKIKKNHVKKISKKKQTLTPASNSSFADGERTSPPVVAEVAQLLTFCPPPHPTEERNIKRGSKREERVKKIEVVRRERDRREKKQMGYFCMWTT